MHVRLPRPLREEYEAVRDMGSGGEADLLLVRHRESDALRVVKVYRGDRHRDETALEILSNADRAHVVAILDSGQHRNRWWEVMEYCEEGSLVDLIEREGPRIPTTRIEEVVREVAAALEHLHGLNIPHRDLKPGNILIRSRDPLDLVLADFGLARVIAATKEMHSRVISAGYVSPQAVNGAVSPAMDWWALGMIVAEMAQGRSPFQREDGEWFPEVTILDRIASRPIELSGVEDPRLRHLCEGLTRRDDRRGRRWGAEEVNAWLEGGEPEVVAEAETARAVSTSPFPFLDPATERTQPFTDPVELATAMAVAWEEALAVLGGSAERRADQRALRNFLRSLDLTEAEQILAEQDDAEERLTRLLVQLHPRIPPTFRGYSIDRKGLLELAESSAEGAASALRAIFSERVLLNYSRSEGYGDLAELDAAWHEAMRHFEATLNRAEAAFEGTLLDGAARAGAMADGVGLILAALIDEEARERLHTAAAEDAADPTTRRQGWFAALAGGVPTSEREPGQAVALVILHSTAEAFEREAAAERAEEERRRKAEEATERREQREETAARRRQAMSRLGHSLWVELGRVIGWTALSLFALTVASAAMTFSPSHADTGETIAAAFSFLWEPLLISAGAAWLAGLVYDLASAARGGTAWSAPLLPVHVIVGIAAPLVLVAASADDGYVPPQVWSLAPYFSAAGFAASLVGRYLWDMPGRPEAPRFVAVALCLAVGGAAWVASTFAFLPSEKAEARAEVKLGRQVTMGNCAPVPVSSLPGGLLRNSIDGMTRCRQGGKTGKFYAFASPELFDLYVSERAGMVEDLQERNSADRCASGGGAYSSEWWDGSNEDNKAGRLFCFGRGSGSTIEWSDKRVDVYLTVTGRSRQVLYRWWRANG